MNPETSYADTSPLINKVAFSLVKGLTLPVAKEILARVGGEENFFRATASELASLNGFSSRVFDQAYRADLLEKARRESEFIESRKIRPLYFGDPGYPSRLLDCDDAPRMIYSFGECEVDSYLPVSIVGTRHATAYGVDFVERLVKGLADKCSSRVVIVSGLAFGIDVAAHRAAINCGLPTVAVLAHGLNMVYPAQHRKVAADIVRSGGALFTEYMSSDPVHKGNFLARNRIVAGMCDALVVAESARKGGALVTARIAGAYNRDVFALPGRTSDRWSEGCNHLIASHSAQLICDADQLIEAMGWGVRSCAEDQPGMFVELSDEEQAVVDWLDSHADAQLNDIAAALNIPHGRLNGMLLELEFKDVIICKPGARYCAAANRT